ncbi:methyltransferase family protein [Aureimonas mangrovi]|uniref:methyltransferase family protein n=1 Tax=Aureimonas mangrovi TaxID=2758041 RepID=UPI00163DE167|nr:isoprenylcysteine carboxylmethyltransferase family protein [Aureimonas mangrovi]
MSQTALLRRDLGRVQSQRKTTIRLLVLLALPLFVLATGNAPAGSLQRDTTEAIGLALVFLAILGRAWCTLYIGGRKIDRLVVTGPYSMMRNPLYGFSFMGAAGLGAQTGSVMLACGFALAAYLVFLPVVRHEERALHRMYGSTYGDYCRNVPRFLPKPSLWLEERSLDIDPVRWRQTVVDALLFLLLVPAVRGLAELQAALPGLTLLRLP